MSIIFLGKAKNQARTAALAKRAGHLSDVHLHGERAALMAWPLRLIFPGRPVVWTCEDLSPRWIIWQAAWVGVEIVATTRETQWRILNAAGVRVRYIPDGYDGPSLPPISVRRFGLWPGRYVAAVAGNADEIAWVKRAYEKVKTKKKLVMVQDKSGSRAERSLFAGAATIILANANSASATVLAAMESGRPIVSVTTPLSEELLGVTALFVAFEDEQGLARAIKTVRPSEKAQKRARAHFTWDRIFSEYLPLYQPAMFTVPLDSAGGIIENRVRVAKLATALALGASAERLKGSSPFPDTLRLRSR